VFNLIARVDRSWIEASFRADRDLARLVESFIERELASLRTRSRAARAVPRVRSFLTRQGVGTCRCTSKTSNVSASSKYRYWRSIDTGDTAALEALFTEDVKVDYIGGSYRWQVQGRDKIIESIANSFNANAVACHTGHHPEIEVLTETTAKGHLVPDRHLHQPQGQDPHDRQCALPRPLSQAERRLAHLRDDVRARLRGSREVRDDAEPDGALAQTRAAAARQGRLTAKGGRAMVGSTAF
jgi:hypothetical protein